MQDLISRQAAIDAFEKELSAKYNRRELAIGFVGVESILRDLSSAQLERKRGRWTRPSRKNTYERFCSECGGKAWFCGKGDYRFCPNCGADMKGEQNDVSR